MKRFAMAASTLVLLAPVFSSPAIAASLTPVDQKIFSALAEVRNVSLESRGSIWPGFDPGAQPIAIYQPGRGAFLLNHPKPPRGFVPVANVPAPLKGRVFVRWGGVPELERARDLFVQLGGKVAFLPYQYLAYDNDVQPREFFAPLFAAYTQQAFADFPEFQRSSDAANKDYPTSNVENTALANLENKILSLALQEKNPERFDDHARYFSAVRHARHDKLDQKIARYESLAETMEGAMRYTEAEYSAYGASAKHRSLPGMRWESKEEATRGIIGRLSQPLDSEETRRSRLSATGAALGLLMDKLGNRNWKGMVTSGNTMDEAIDRVVRFSDRDAPHLFAIAKQLYGYDQLFSNAKDTWARFPSSYKDFMQNSGTKVTISGLAKVKDNGGHELDPKKRKEWMRVGGPTPPIEIDGQTLFAYRMDVFNYRKGGVNVVLRETPMVMKSADLSWPFANVTFFLDPKTLKIELDGREVALRNGTYPFRRDLKMAGERVNVTATQGTLKVDDKEISLSVKR